jgi:hypothetical protein
MIRSPDSIISAIERHRRAGMTLSRAAKRADEAIALAEGREVTAEDKAALRAADEGARRAVAEIRDNPPRTNEGLAALAAYVAEIDDRATKDELFRVLIRSPLLAQ